MEVTTKIFTRRDSATALLRKLGVDKADYDKYITRLPNGGGTQVQIPVANTEEEIRALGDAAADDSLSNLPAEEPVQPEPEEEKPTEGKKPKKDKPLRANQMKRVDQAVADDKKPPRPPSIAARARELIKAGKTNQEAFDVLAEEFGLDEKRKHYPAWYRTQMKKKGEI